MTEEQGARLLAVVEKLTLGSGDILWRAFTSNHGKRGRLRLPSALLSQPQMSNVAACWNNGHFGARQDVLPAIVVGEQAFDVGDW